MTSATVIGKALARAIDVREGLFGIELPRGISGDLIDATVEEANAKAAGRGIARYCVEVARSEYNDRGAVHPEEVIRYRAGRHRLFVWEAGQFEPDSSFASSVRSIVTHDFPARTTSELDLSSLAVAIVDEIRSVNEDRFDDGGWAEFHTGLEAVINFSASLFDAAGNEGLDTWMLGWWGHLLMTVDNLLRRLAGGQSPATEPGILPFAAACFPVPDNTQSMAYRHLTAKKYLASLSANWSSEDDINMSLSKLYRGSDNDSHPEVSALADLDWVSSYPRLQQITEHPVLALTQLRATDNRPAPEIWAETRESHFLLLTGRDPLDIDLSIAVDGVSLPELTKHEKSAPVFLFPTQTASRGVENGRGLWTLPTAEVELSTEWPVSLEGENLDGAIAVHSTGKFLSVRKVVTEASEGQVLVNLDISLDIPSKGTWPTKPIKITLKPSPKGPLAQYLEGVLTFELAFPDPWSQPSLAIRHAIGKSKPKITLVSGGKYVIDKAGQVTPVDESESTAIKLRSNSHGSIWAYDGSEADEASAFSYRSQACSPSSNWARLFCLAETHFEQDDEVYSVGKTPIELARFLVEESTVKPWLPVLATALGVPPAQQETAIPHEDKNSLRGELERLISQGLRMALSSEGEVARMGLLQFLVAEGQTGNLFKGVDFNEKGPYWIGGAPSHFQPIQHAGDGPTKELIETNEFREFWRKALDVVSAINLFESEVDEPWVSRCTLADVDEAIINGYLQAYTRLVNTASSLSRGDQFWARYPFSAMLLDKRGRSIRGVLLSPMHPVRLGWLYGAEQAVLELGDGAGAPPLLQVLEGWNFPWVGQAPGAKNAYPVFAAMPMDIGISKLFAGWGLLVAFDNYGGPAELASWFAGRRAPGSAASGLTAGGIAAAIRDYTKVHPFISTLTVDLAAMSTAPRSMEIDRAILNEVGNLAQSPREEFRLLGGVRVADSLNREGDPPEPEALLENVNEEARNSPAWRFVWHRYDANSDSPNADIRFIERGPSSFSVVDGGRAASTTYWPVRRFIPKSGEAVTELHGLFPSLDSTTSWHDFKEALCALEISESGSFSLQVDNQDILTAQEPHSAWLVTGNVQTDPFVLAQAAARQGRVLWEWRPGFLPKRIVRTETGAFGVRPYTTIASIPDSFREGVKKSIDCDEENVNKIFSELGSRGIGLASLLAMGMTHVSGALGFYLAYKLLDELPKPADINRFVVPLDAVDLIFRAIANETLTDETKRADLLVVDVDSAKKAIRLIPIEIKCYPKSSGSFPSTNTAQVESALLQLKDTMSVVGKAISKIALDGDTAAGDSSHTRVRASSLQLSALATVIECGVTLSRHTVSTESVREILSGVTAGSYSVARPKNLLFWFQSSSGEPVDWCPDQPEPSLGVLFADVHTLKERSFSSSQLISDSISSEMAEWMHPSSDSATTKSRSNIAAQKPANGRQPEVTVPATNVGDEEVQSDTNSVRSEEQVTSKKDAGTRNDGRIVFTIGADRQRKGSNLIWDPFHPNSRLSNCHWVILGGSGAGKTQSIKALVSDLVDQEVTPMLLDFKDDFVDSGYLQELGAELFDAEDGLPFNPLEPGTDDLTGRVKIRSEVYSISDTLTKVHGLGDQQQANLRSAVFQAYEAKGISKNLKHLSSDQELPDFDDVGRIIEESQDVKLYNRLSPIFDLGLFRSDREGIESLLKRPSVVRLSQLPGEEVKRAAGELLLKSFYNFMVRQGHSDYLKYAVVIDEAHKIANLASVKLLLKESRAYGVAVILSSQEARDFEDYVYANAGTLLALKLSETGDSERVAMLLGGASSKQRLGQEIRGLRPFSGFVRNDHYNRPYSKVEVLPHFKRK